MNSLEIKELRRKQYLGINMFVISFAAIAGSIILIFEASRLVVLIGLIMMFFVVLLTMLFVAGAY
ncbi:hypothetical protein [Bacillus sp. FJAT-45350]|uniref:hypothetical protein n=1 Tax=Bacillus sp. FJAT-45350 TaxID=2011014 RepID=UPI000BB7EBA0|nr:hypothetical protein [Bacillus sp. FJAT-45350]